MRKKPLVALLTNNDDDVFCFRLELLQAIRAAGYELLISCPDGPKFSMPEMRELEYLYDDPDIDRRGTNVIRDGKLLLHYRRLFRKHRPAVVLTYTAKPNVYGSMAAHSLKIPVINNVTGYYKRAAAANQSGAAGEIPDSFGVKTIFSALESGGRGVITVAVACGIAGVICGCITVTGLANQLISAIVGVSGNSLLLGLFLTMLCCIVLGMGVPTTATYCIMASTCAPILIKMGVPAIAAHFFVFYYGIVADITPPVALAAYAGAAIAKGKPMQTGVTATRLAIGAFIIPFVFAISPALLFVDTTLSEVILITVTATLGMIGVAAGLSGYLAANMNILERLLCIGGGLMLIMPGLATDLGGIGLIALVVVIQSIRKKKAAAA